MKCIRVGDPHVTLSNMKDSEKLMEFIVQKAEEHKVDRVEFMGDLFHNHAVKRLEVERFWYQAFQYITKSGFDVLSIVGNHDQMGKGSEEFSALDTFSHLPNVRIIHAPESHDNITYIGYHRDINELVELANTLPSKCLISHATFSGAKYENGFEAEDGVNAQLFVHDEIISGHIHKQQQVGKCFYMGTPKWDTLSDANHEKGIWLFEHNEDGSVKSKEFISTKLVVTPIMKYTVNEGDEIPEINPAFKNYIELVGKSSWITKIKKQIKGLAQIKGRPTDRLTRTKISQDGGMLDISEFLDQYFDIQKGVDKQAVKEYINNIEV